MSKQKKSTPNKKTEATAVAPTPVATAMPTANAQAALAGSLLMLDAVCYSCLNYFRTL